MNPAAIWVSYMWRGIAAHGVGEHVEVLLGGVEHGHRLGLEQLGQQAGVGGERVDEGDAAGPGELDERQLGEVRALPVELGVDRVPRLCDELVDEGRECRRRRRSSGRHEGGSPPTSPRPDSIHAIVPPATFTASSPWAAANSAARMLRPPTADHVRRGVGSEAVEVVGHRASGISSAPATWPRSYSSGSRDVDDPRPWATRAELVDADLGHRHGGHASQSPRDGEVKRRR